MIAFFIIGLLFCELHANSAAGEQKAAVEALEVAQFRKRYSDEQMKVVEQQRAAVAEWFGIRLGHEYRVLDRQGKRASDQALQAACRGCFKDLKAKFPQESLEDLAKVLVTGTAAIEKDLTSIHVLFGEGNNSFVLYEMEVRESLWISCAEIAQSLRRCCHMACGCCRKKDLHG